MTFTETAGAGTAVAAPAQPAAGKPPVVHAAGKPAPVRASGHGSSMLGSVSVRALTSTPRPDAGPGPGAGGPPEVPPAGPGVRLVPALPLFPEPPRRARPA